jgi:hypothetical protein
VRGQPKTLAQIMSESASMTINQYRKIYPHDCIFDAWFTTSTTRRGPYCVTCLAQGPDYHETTYRVLRDVDLVEWDATPPPEPAA